MKLELDIIPALVAIIFALISTYAAGVQLEFSAGMVSANNRWKEVLRTAAAALREGR